MVFGEVLATFRVPFVIALILFEDSVGLLILNKGKAIKFGLISASLFCLVLIPVGMEEVTSPLLIVSFAPPPNIMAEVLPNQAVTFGHQTNGAWEETWQFVLFPQVDGTTRLTTRTSTNMIGGAWDVIRLISFVMEREMLMTIKDLSER
jgi:hypothetical protein